MELILTKEEEDLVEEALRNPGYPKDIVPTVVSILRKMGRETVVVSMRDTDSLGVITLKRLQELFEEPEHTGLKIISMTGDL